MSGILNLKAIKAAEAAHRRQFKNVGEKISELPISDENKTKAMDAINADYNESLKTILKAIIDPPPVESIPQPVTPIEAPPAPAPENNLF